MKPKALVLHANGINRDHDVSQAIHAAGGEAEILHLNQLLAQKTNWLDYQMLVLPGGFAYADALGAGRMMAIALGSYFSDQIQEFVGRGRPVIGICNGFQALVKAGILPGGEVRATLTFNTSGHFECRWVRLAAPASRCLWTAGLEDGIDCPVAHGEGRFVTQETGGIDRLFEQGQVALLYADGQGQPVDEAYPANPNGSARGIAGVCNAAGNVLGLMPHPENHIHNQQYPHWTSGEQGRLGLTLFQNGVRAAGGV